MVVWLVIVLGGEILQAGQGSLEAPMSEQIVIALIVAPLFLLAVIAYFKWDIKLPKFVWVVAAAWHRQKGQNGGVVLTIIK